MQMNSAPNSDGNKAYTLKWNEMSGNRWDPYFFMPELTELDRKISAMADGTLQELTITINSGATPNNDEKEKYDSNTEHGVPLLRVQNITDEGLDLDDCTFINYETHENYLKQSKVFENDLLITIAGRIANCAVAPKGFEGNINQNCVVVKTENRKRSELIAAFLNSNIGHTLALKRATGGTRPTLDYDALKKMPIILNDEIFLIMDTAYKQKAEMIKHVKFENEEILQKKDAELFDEIMNDRCEKTFYLKWSENQNRLDPSYYLQDKEISIVSPKTKIQNDLENIMNFESQQNKNNQEKANDIVMKAKQQVDEIILGGRY